MPVSAEEATEHATDRETSVETSDFRRDVLEGLRAREKAIPCKHLYDERGSQLFDQICEQPEYYPTRTEIAITRDHIDEIVEKIGPEALLVEYGSGTSEKTRLLLAAHPSLAGYVPIDIACLHVQEAAEKIRDEHPELRVEPLCADYTEDFELPNVNGDARRRVAYFPGSTIGNFDPEDAQDFLARIAETVGAGGGLLLGVDLMKDEQTLRAAYNDEAGVTAAFNKNLLRRMKRELDAELSVDDFAHEGRYNPGRGCMEMHLVSQTAQAIVIGDEAFSFPQGETIRTERSHKFTRSGFARLARRAGFRVDAVWTDADDLFSVQYLERAA
jgi:dimethylhistidine N-methyltransferase